MSSALHVASLIFILSLSRASAQCQFNYVYNQLNGLCYKYVNTLFAESTAETQCTLENGHLVSILSAADNKFAVDVARITSSAPFWIGLTYYNGQYIWTDNSPATYTNWYTGFPNLNYGNCVVLLPDDQYQGKWINSDCPGSKPFMCKNRGGALTTTTSAGPDTCPTQNTYQDSGTIMSPGYPVQYPNRLNCFYHLTVRLGSTVTVKFSSDFSTEKCCDIVTVFDGDDPLHSKVMERLSGKDGADKSLTSTKNEMLINFYTDESQTDKGWSATFSTTGNLCLGGAVGVGQCIAGNCPIGSACNPITNECCSTTGGNCPNGQTPVGQCIAGECPAAYTCITASNICCSSSGMSTTLSPGNCGDGWGYDIGSQYCYQLHKERQSWDAASATCEASRGELVSIHTPQQNAFVMSFVSSGFGNFDYYVWAGLRINGQPSWSDNSPVNFLNWLQGEPNGGNGCMALQSWNPTGWRLINNCYTTLPFVCIKPAPGTH